MGSIFSKIISRRLFAVRPVILLLFVAATMFLAMQTMQVSINTDVRKMIPLKHRYIKNFLEHREDVSLGNDIHLIMADSRNDDIFNDKYMQALKTMTNDVFTLPDVDPSKISSLWTPDVRWNEMTEEGFQNDEVIPDNYD